MNIVNCTQVILTKMTKHMHKWIAVKPPGNEKIIASVPWIRNDTKLLNFIKVSHYT